LYKLKLWRGRHIEIRVGQVAHIGLRVLLLAWAITAVLLQRHFALVRLALPVTLLGAACNFLAKLSNGGRMPVYARAVLPESHQPMTEDTKFKSLCDMYRALGCVWSLGDLLMLFSSVFGLAAAAGLWTGKFLNP
jgi:Family of unknown function (DUF5317)